MFNLSHNSAGSVIPIINLHDFAGILAYSVAMSSTGPCPLALISFVTVNFARKFVARCPSCALPEVEPGLFLCAFTASSVLISLHCFVLFPIVCLQSQVPLCIFLQTLNVPIILRCFLILFSRSSVSIIVLMGEPLVISDAACSAEVICPEHCAALPVCALAHLLGPCVALVLLLPPAPPPIVSLLASQS